MPIIFLILFLFFPTLKGGDIPLEIIEHYANQVLLLADDIIKAINELELNQQIRVFTQIGEFSFDNLFINPNERNERLLKAEPLKEIVRYKDTLVLSAGVLKLPRETRPDQILDCITKYSSLLKILSQNVNLTDHISQIKLLESEFNAEITKAGYIAPEKLPVSWNFLEIF